MNVQASPSGAALLRETSRALPPGPSRSAEIAAGMAQGYPVVGMDTVELAAALGQPGRVNQADYGRGIEEQRIYERGGRTFFVYTQGGIIRSFQNNANGTVVRTEPCPSSTEIRNVRVSASSITKSPAEREQMLEQARRMEACR